MNMSVNYGGVNSIPYLDNDMPARAKRLFLNTFRRYHRLDAGGEELAIRAAWDAVNKDYVKLNNRWMPKTAAQEIVRHDIDDGGSSADEDSAGPLTRSSLRKKTATATPPATRPSLPSDDEDLSTTSSSEEEEDDDDDEDYDYARDRFNGLNRNYSIRRHDSSTSLNKRRNIAKNKFKPGVPLVRRTTKSSDAL